MDIDEFWHLIERSAQHRPNEARLQWLQQELMRRPVEDIGDQ
ncbi:DUF4240 domain-containing protein [Nonomuraea ceibae]|nr:DUF4240 domain-containing protein [Nonomuraea ceibae]